MHMVTYTSKNRMSFILPDPERVANLTGPDIRCRTRPYEGGFFSFLWIQNKLRELGKYGRAPKKTFLQVCGWELHTYRQKVAWLERAERPNGIFNLSSVYDRLSFKRTFHLFAITDRRDKWWRCVVFCYPLQRRQKRNTVHTIIIIPNNNNNNKQATTSSAPYDWCNNQSSV